MRGKRWEESDLKLTTATTRPPISATPISYIHLFNIHGWTGTSGTPEMMCSPNVRGSKKYSSWPKKQQNSNNKNKIQENVQAPALWRKGCYANGNHSYKYSLWYSMMSNIQGWWKDNHNQQFNCMRKADKLNIYLTGLKLDPKIWSSLRSMREMFVDSVKCYVFYLKELLPELDIGRSEVAEGYGSQIAV